MKSGIRALALFGITMAMMSGCNFLERRHCNNCHGPLGCRPCRIGWQRGGTDYGAHLSGGHLAALHGMGGHGVGGHFAGNGAAGHLAGSHAGKEAYLQNNQVGSGVPGPAVAYPYYTVRGPRDFFADNPPSIGR